MPTPAEHHPRYPIYIVSKGRHESRYTMKALDRLGVKYYVAVEPQEFKAYKNVIDPKYGTVLELPFSNHGMGSGPARNWVWEHSQANGFKRHWVLDDNISEFWRYHNNRRIRVETGSIFRATEDFVDRFKNVPLSGLQYKFFVVDNSADYKPFVTNTRLMSCILIENTCPHKWRGKYNEDVDLSLRVLKDGYCTILVYAFLAGKMRTGTIKGGNTTEIYGDGTFKKSKMLVDLHPDCVKLVRRYGRWHHHVDIERFKGNKLIPVDNLVIPDEPNEYGMKFVKNHKTTDEVEFDIKQDIFAKYYVRDEKEAAADKTAKYFKTYVDEDDDDE
jgi:hypothetical protein